MTYYCGTPNMIKVKAPDIDKISIPHSRQSKVAQFLCWKSPQTTTPFFCRYKFTGKQFWDFFFIYPLAF
jgi:hypothetical protein